MFKIRLLSRKTAWAGVLCMLLIPSVAILWLSGPQAPWAGHAQIISTAQAASMPPTKCDKKNIANVTKGYGANGPYSISLRTIPNPFWSEGSISVLFPRGAAGKRPVVFFSHGWGPAKTTITYADFVDHMVSIGYIVIFVPYNTLATADVNYQLLKNGFDLAVKTYNSRMDLTRVAYLGHSFGAGATPAMAYEGLVNKGYGTNGAFLYMLAPYYSYQITQEQLQEFPSSVVLSLQVYDNDTRNDHRMAIDIFRNTAIPEDQKSYLLVHSVTINGCPIIANHQTPGSNASLRLKQYSVFRTFDALNDCVMNQNQQACEVVSNPDLYPTASYQPMTAETDPRPDAPESSYANPWTSSKNPRQTYGGF